MMTPSPGFVGTDVGALRVRRTGSGPPVVLWHSLFLDSRSWCGLEDDVGAATGTSSSSTARHTARSEAIARDFTFEECVAAAEQVLDAAGLTAPVDWVGNAWGGHVGIQLAVHRPHRIRTLTTIGTPAHGLRPVERWTKVLPLVQLYRVAGPTQVLLKPLSDALVGPESVAATPDQAAAVMRAFTEADRPSMFRAMRSMMLNRPDMRADMARIAAPTLLIAGRDDSTGWRPADAQAVADTMRNARVVAAAGSGHSSPLLIDMMTVERALEEFWAAANAK